MDLLLVFFDLVAERFVLLRDLLAVERFLGVDFEVVFRVGFLRVERDGDFATLVSSLICVECLYEL